MSFAHRTFVEKGLHRALHFSYPLVMLRGGVGGARSRH